MKEKNLQQRLFYPARLSFRFDGKIKSFTDKQKLIREFSTTKLALQINAKGTSLGRKEETTTGNKKITNGKAHQ